MKRVYVCGKLRDNNPLDYLKHVYKMTSEAEKILKAGFAVFVPGWDLILNLSGGNSDFKEVFNNSIEWLKVSDALYVCDNWRTSKGSKKEIKMAKKLGIPVFFDLNSLIKYMRLKNEKI